MTNSKSLASIHQLSIEGDYFSKAKVTLEATLELSSVNNDNRKQILNSNLKDYVEKIESISYDDMFSVPTQIGVPIIEKLSYLENNEISDLFVNLLATASSQKTIQNAHPSFINIINNISVDEARILYYLKLLNGKRIGYIFLRAYRNNIDGFQDLTERLTGIEKRVELLFPENMLIYLENFVGLGLLDIKHGEYIVGTTVYEDLESEYIELKMEFENEIVNRPELQFSHLDYQKGLYQITNLGVSFIDACTSMLQPNDNHGTIQNSEV